ncbi:tetratricopeptide repeat protein [candidate division KSB1 bacterium]|nr:tetratricopeptide repeat protein [candidate division KSB1 bacterium]
MRARLFITVMILAILISVVIPGQSWSQLPVRIKRSNDLTQSAVSSIKEKQFDRAKDQLTRAIRLNPKNVLANELAALIFYKENDFANAKKHAKVAYDMNKNSPRALYVLGALNYQQGDEDLARTQLEQSVKSLKDPEERQRAGKLLEKIRANTKDRVSTIKSKIEPEPKPAEASSDDLAYKPYIAAFPFSDANARTEQTKLGQTLTEMLITALIQDDKFSVMERVQLEKILQEQSLGQTGTIDAETAVEVGKLSGLEAIVVGSISQLKTAIEADARLIEVETGKALTAASGKVNSIDDLRDLANKLSKQLSAKAYLFAPEADSTKMKAKDLD